jgi:hypothetical protein
MLRGRRTYWCSFGQEPTLALEVVSMKDFASRTWIGLALSAAALSGICAFFITYAYPWPSVAWGVIACGIAVWVGLSSDRPSLQVGDVIDVVEAESRVAAVPAQELTSRN